MMKKNHFLLATFLLVWTFTFAQKTEILCNVMFKDKKIGVLRAQEITSELESYKTLSIETKTRFLFIPIHIESEVRTTQKNGILMEGTAYRNASFKSKDITAKVANIGFSHYQIERNGVKDKIKNECITFCVVDLYFSEPVGVTQVFSNMFAEMLQLERMDIGIYQLISPDNNNSVYTYIDGQLVSIEVHTLAGKVLSKRI
jgi:hypothetical protein